MSQTKTVDYKINTSIHGFKPGAVVSIAVDKKGTPLDRTWRRRLKDAKIDGCITKVVQAKPETSTKDKDK